MSRFQIMQAKLDTLERENEQLKSINRSAGPPEKTRIGLIESLQNEIEEREWVIIRARSDIQVFEKAIKELRGKDAEARRLKRAAAQR